MDTGKQYDGDPRRPLKGRQPVKQYSLEQHTI